jgi:heptosyltransferase I
VQFRGTAAEGAFAADRPGALASAADIDDPPRPRSPLSPPGPAPRPPPPGGRVCIVMLTGLGDVVNALPLANALKDHDPSLHVSWVVEPMAAPILSPHPSVDDVIVYRKSDGARGVVSLLREMRKRSRFDLTLNLHPYFKSVWGTLFSRARRRVGYDRARSFDQVWLAATERLAPRPRQHTLDMFLEFAAHLGVPVREVEWRIAFTERERREQAEFFAAQERPLAVLVPTSGNARKDWFAHRWARVADALEHDYGFRAALLGGGGARETAVAAEIGRLARIPPLSLMGGPLRQSAWLLEGSALVLGPDTGPLHLARALGKPVIGLFGHTNPWRVGPYCAWQDLWVDRYTDPGAAPDASDFRPRHGRMEQITVEDVLDRVERAMPFVRERPGRTMDRRRAAEDAEPRRTTGAEQE